MEKNRSKMGWLKVDDRRTQVRVISAVTFWSRARGLLGHSRLRGDEALWISPCNSVHTFGMTYAIDVLFLDRQQRVVKVTHRLKSMRIAGTRAAYSTLELLGGVASSIGVAEGMRLTVEEA